MLAIVPVYRGVAFLLGISHMTIWVIKSYIGSLKRRVMVYKSSELLLLLPIGFRMEPHLGLLSWILVEVSSFLKSPQRVVSKPMHELAEVTRRCWSSGNMCAAAWLDGVDKLLIVAWHLGKGFRSRGLVRWYSCVRRRLLGISHMSNKVAHREFEKNGHGI